MHTLVDMTMLQIDISGVTIDDETAHDRVRAYRVVAYIRQRFPPVRDDDASDAVNRRSGLRRLAEVLATAGGRSPRPWRSKRRDAVRPGDRGSSIAIARWATRWSASLGSVASHPRPVASATLRDANAGTWPSTD